MQLPASHRTSAAYDRMMAVGSAIAHHQSVAARIVWSEDERLLQLVGSAEEVDRHLSRQTPGVITHGLLCPVERAERT